MTFVLHKTLHLLIEEGCRGQDQEFAPRLNTNDKLQLRKCWLHNKNRNLWIKESTHLSVSLDLKLLPSALYWYNIPSRCKAPLVRDRILITECTLGGPISEYHHTTRNLFTLISLNRTKSSKKTLLIFFLVLFCHIT